MDTTNFVKDHPILLCIDIESTGLKWWDGEDIVEFGYLVFEFSGTVGKYEKIEDGDWFVKIDYPMPEEALKIHKITNEFLDKNGMSRIKFWTKLGDLFKRYPTALLIAYNTQFDASFVQQEIRRASEEWDRLIKNPMLDVMAIYRDRYKYPHKLKNAIAMMGVDAVNSHRAVDDIFATYEVFKALMTSKYDAHKYINRFGYLRKYGVTGDRFPQITYVGQGFNGYREVAHNYDIELIKKESK